MRQPNGATGGGTVKPTPEEIFAGNSSADEAGANGVAAAADAAGHLSLYTAGIERTVKVTGLQDVAIYDVYAATHTNPEGGPNAGVNGVDVHSHPPQVKSRRIDST